MRTVHRPRRYVSQRWLSLMMPLLRYSASRDAYVLRGVGNDVGPVVRRDRRLVQRRRFEGQERRRTSAA